MMGQEYRDKLKTLTNDELYEIKEITLSFDKQDDLKKEKERRVREHQGIIDKIARKDAKHAKFASWIAIAISAFAVIS